MLVALSHAYPPGWNLGGEVALHRLVKAAERPATVVTRTLEPYRFDGVDVVPFPDDVDPLNHRQDPDSLVRVLADAGASIVLCQNELAFPAVRAARLLGIPSVVYVHAPPRYGRVLRDAIPRARAVVYNTHQAAREWRRRGIVVHPPVTDLPPAATPSGDAYTLLSNLLNKGVTVALELARRLPDRRFIIVRSDAESTHGMQDFAERAAELPNVEVHERVPPQQVAERFFSQTRILLVPSRYETYGMSALEAAGFGIPSIHVDTAHVREGIGDAAELIGPLDVEGAFAAVSRIEGDYRRFSARARARAEWVAERQAREFAEWRNLLSML